LIVLSGVEDGTGTIVPSTLDLRVEQKDNSWPPKNAKKTKVICLQPLTFPTFGGRGGIVN
jgi:hypothetical protein